MCTMAVALHVKQGNIDFMAFGVVVTAVWVVGLVSRGRGAHWVKRRLRILEEGEQ